MANTKHSLNEQMNPENLKNNFLSKIQSASKANCLADLIELLIEMWTSWLEMDGIARNNMHNFSQRRLAAENCEALIFIRYRIISSIDDYFDRKFSEPE